MNSVEPRYFNEKQESLTVHLPDFGRHDDPATAF